LADGGVRSGLDVVRMLAMGAKGVMLGRAWAFALAARGEKGVAHMLEIVKKEMSVAMALTGARNLAELSRDSIERLP
jgi:L-lactate dehydrogenase (cytochrome)